MRLNGLDFHVESHVEGDADADAQPVSLLLLHGFTGSTRAWDDVRERLRDASPISGPPIQVIVIDLIGHGRSATPADPARYSVEHAAADLAAVLDALGLARVHLLGYSMGGRLALAFAVHHPDRLASLILESASPGIEDLAERARRARSDDALAETIERDGLAAFVDAWEQQPLLQLAPHVSAEVRARQHALRLENTPRGLANSLRGMGTGRQPSYWAALDQLHVPTCLLSGALDSRYTEIAARMQARLPRAERSVLQAAGHTAHLDQPVEFACLVAEFVAAATRASTAATTRHRPSVKSVD